MDAIMTAKKKEAYERIRHCIITNEIGPNTALNEKELMSRFDIGRTPLREIFVRLQADGLIQIIPRVGTIVSPINIKDIREIVEFRRELEAFAGTLAAKRITPAQLSELGAIVQQMQAIQDREHPDMEMLGRLDGNFHDRVYLAADNKELLHSLRRVRVAMYRHWYFGEIRGSAFLSHYQFLKDALEGLKAHDGAKTRQALENHVDDFVVQLKELLSA